MVCPHKHGPVVQEMVQWHDDIMSWKHFPHYWPSVWEIHWSPFDSQRRASNSEVLMFFVVGLQKLLSKYSICWWPVTPDTHHWNKNWFCYFLLQFAISLFNCSIPFNWLGTSDAIWWHKSGSTLAQVMACCLTASSHYLNQCWFLIGEILWHSSQSNFRVSAQTAIQQSGRSPKVVALFLLQTLVAI